MAHQMLRFASEMSYRQYCILALALHASSFDLFEDHASSIGRQNLSGAQTSFLSDCWDLRMKGLLWTGTDHDLHLYEIRPGYLSLQPLGLTFATALGLESIQSQDITPLADLFIYGHAWKLGKMETLPFQASRAGTPLSVWGRIALVSGASDLRLETAPAAAVGVRGERGFNERHAADTILGRRRPQRQRIGCGATRMSA